MIKYDPGVNVIEGENMLYIGGETTVLVPRVYAIYTATETSGHAKNRVESNYIVMENIEGSTLDFE
jgi:hypothetical protein